jgi:hypothetical protein
VVLAFFWLFGQNFGVGIDYFGAEGGGEAVGGLVDLMELASEVGGRGGDGGDAEGGSVPDDSFVKFGYGEVETVAELILHGAEDLAAVFEGLGVGDLQFDGELSYGHMQSKDVAERDIVAIFVEQGGPGVGIRRRVGARVRRIGGDQFRQISMILHWYERRATSVCCWFCRCRVEG